MSEDSHSDLAAGLLGLRERIANLAPHELQDRHEIERLRGSLELFRTIVDTVGTSIVGLYPDHSIFAWNNEAERVFGADRREVMGKDFIELFIPEELQERVSEVMRSVVAGTRVHGQEYEIVSRNGSRHTLLWNLNQVTDKEGLPVGVIGCGQDISFLKQAEQEVQEANRALEQRVEKRTAQLQREVEEHRRTEERLQTEEYLFQRFMDNIPDHIFFKDRESRFTRVNRGLIEWLSRNGAEDIIGRTDADFFAAEHARKARADELLVMEHGRPMVYEEEKETWPDGRETWVTTTKLPLRDREGAIIGTFGISRDVTDEVLGRLELKCAADELARSNEELSQFAHVVSHDLQEPLRLLITYCQLLKEQCGQALDERGNECLEFAVQEAGRMKELIHDLLSFARAGQGAARYQLTDCDEVVRECLDGLTLLMEESGADVRVEDLPVVEAERSQLIQVFQNLIGNALKFRNTEVPRIRIGAKRDGLAWQFSIADNGIGIEPDYAEKVFIIFERLHAREAFAGTGIGLAICKRIVEGHGGRIWFDSEQGRGSTFYFTIPVHREDGMVLAQAQSEMD